MLCDDNYDLQVVFREEQDFRHPFIYIIIFFSNIVIIGSIALNLFSQNKMAPHRPYNKIEGLPLILSIILPLALVVMLDVALLWMKLITEIRVDSVKIHLTPFNKRIIKYTEIEKIEAITYNPILKYGGYGYHIGWGWRCYNAIGSGNRAAQLTLKDHKRIIIGSRESENIIDVIRTQASSQGIKL